MALNRNLNKAGFGGNYFMWWVYKTLVTSGWVVDASGSGTGGTYNATGDVFDPAGGNPYNSAAGIASGKLGSGSGSEPWMAAASAWILLEDPIGGQWLIQSDDTESDASDAEWIVAYSPSGAFALGGCNTDTAPTAADQHVFFGTINGAGLSICADGTTANMTHVMANDAPSAAGAYGLIAFSVVSTNTLQSVFMIDPLAQCKSDLFQSVSDGKLPFTILIGGGSSMLDWANIFQEGVVTAEKPQALIDYGGGAENWETVGYAVCLSGAVTILIPGNAGAPSDGQPDSPIIVGSTINGGALGISEYLEWQATARSYPTTDDTKNAWYIGDVAILIGDGVTDPTNMP